VNKLAVVTRFDRNYLVDAGISSISHPLLRAYAERCSADFLVISERKVCVGPFHNEIYQCHELLNRYDRILCIDSDVIVVPDAPNLFELVPHTKIASVFEDVGYRKKARRRLIRFVQYQREYVGWDSGYINSGVLLFSRCHQDIFRIDGREIWNHWGYDDVELGFRIHHLKIPLMELPRCCNHVSAFSEFGKDWLDAKFIHYGGNGFYPRMPKSQQMCRDLKLLRQSRMIRKARNLLYRLRLVLVGAHGFIVGDGLMQVVKELEKRYLNERDSFGRRPRD